MMRRHWLGSLFVCAFMAGPAAADSLSVVLELEGTLSESRGRFTLNVGDQGQWTLELNDARRQDAREILKKNLATRVLVEGTLPVRVAGNTLVFPARTIRVKSLTEGIPLVKVVAVFPGYPAAGYLKAGDIIREIEGQEIYGRLGLRKVLAAHRGKRISMVVSRGGEGEVIDGITLRQTGGPLGIKLAIVWSWHGGMQAMEGDEGE
jgi:hypothetical protein